MDWIECPKCGGEIEYDNFDFDGECWQPRRCVECGFEWQAVYTFSHNETLICELLDDNGNIVKEE